MIPSVHQIQSAVESLLDESLADLPRATRQRLGAFLLGILLAGTIVLRRVATTQAAVGLSAASAASHERRLRRTLSDPLVQAAPTYGRVVRRVLRTLRSPQRVVVIVDESGHSDVVRTLVAALWYRGRALPLHWIVWPAQVPRAPSYWTDSAALLAQVAALLPPGLHVTVVADRAFGCPAFTDLVVAHGWAFVVRVQGHTRFRQAAGPEQPVRSVVQQAGDHWAGSGHVFKKQGWRMLSVVAYWRRGCASPLLLVSNLPPRWAVVLTYRRRSAIEALFRDWKTSWWQWERSQVRDVAHQAALVVLLALATLVTVCLGEEAAQAILAAAPQQGSRRPWAARDSVFRLGRDRLWARIWQGDQTPIAWTLSQAEGPNWSEACWRSALPQPAPIDMTGRLGQREKRYRVMA